MKFLKGQVSILGFLGIGVSVLIATIGGYFAQTNRTDVKMEKYEDKISIIRERTAKLETAVENIQKDTKETRDDVKQLIRELRAKR